MKSKSQKKDEKGITVKKSQDMAEWYSQVVIKSELADYSPIKGCMVIRPNGYAIWQKIMDYFNKAIAKKGVRNAYFPLFIPESFFKREAEHAEGFSPEVAWVASKKDEAGDRLAIRPTSETIIYDSFSRWIRSWRDLPFRVNQWCNIVRWEVKDVKLFLRSREFLWQEGHCAYETEQECEKETLEFLEEYRKVAEDLLAIPVITGKKTEAEKFAGALRTYSIEGFMPDGKALQLGTSHNLGTGFAKAFGISFKNKEEKEQLTWQSSWGISTRMIGGMVMTHSDDKGLIIPPKAAEKKIVIIPIYFDKGKKEIMGKAKELCSWLKSNNAFVDDNDNYSPGWKFNEYELKGIPLRLEIGPRELKKEEAIAVKRNTGEKRAVSWKSKESFIAEISKILDEIQEELFKKAKKRLDESTIKANTLEELKKAAEAKKLALGPFCGEPECEERLREKLKGITTRNIPLEWLKKPETKKREELAEKKCLCCGKPAKCFCYFSRAY